MDRGLPLQDCSQDQNSPSSPACQRDRSLGQPVRNAEQGEMCHSRRLACEASTVARLAGEVDEDTRSQGRPGPQSLLALCLETRQSQRHGRRATLDGRAGGRLSEGQRSIDQGLPEAHRRGRAQMAGPEQQSTDPVARTSLRDMLGWRASRVSFLASFLLLYSPQQHSVRELEGSASVPSSMD